MNKVVLVTGGTRGIGKAIIKEFAKENYNIIFNYLNSEDIANKIKKELEKEFNIKILTFKTDISDENKVIKMVNKSIKEFGKIDVLVNNAGIVIDKNFNDRTIKDWLKTLKINLVSPFIISRLVGNEMLKRKKGKIINIASTSGINSFFPTSVDYDASKAALINLNHNLAIQYAPYINVNAVAPGWVNTDMNKDLPDELIKSEVNKIYLKRFAEPEEIAKLVCFLASDNSNYINDEIIKIDGGSN